MSVPSVVARPRVDVGVVTWNTRDLTVQALRSLLDSDQGCDVRLLVHDNASEDGTVDALRAQVPEAEVTAGESNLGFAAGVNRLLARSDAPWFMALNSDAWPEPGCLATLVDAAHRHPAAAIVVPRLERPDGALEHSTYPFPSVRVAAFLAVGAPRWRPAAARRLLLEGAWQHDEERQVDWAVGAAWLMRREAIDDVGGLDERFFMYVEDVEWCFRARQRHWEIWLQPDAVVRHVGNASGQQRFGRLRTRAHLQNGYQFFRDTHGRSATAAYRMLNLAATGRLYLQARARGRHDDAAQWAEHVRVHLRPH
jgi:N-acetylglucosaminyl-diphospho-decaprenol L-rhamnosyltransferase